MKKTSIFLATPFTFNGTSWSAATNNLGSVDAGEWRVSCPMEGVCIAISESENGAIYADGKWKKESSAPPDQALSCATSVFCAAVGIDGKASTFNGSAWSAPMTVFTGNPLLDSVSCPSEGFCVAVNAKNAYVLSSGTWSTITNADAAEEGYLRSVSCTSPTFCMAVDYEGNVITTASTPATSVYVSPTHLTLSEPVRAGSHSGTSTISVTNDGPASVSIAQDAITSQFGTAPVEFGIVPGMDSCRGTILAPYETCTVYVALAPGQNASSGSITQYLSFSINEVGGTYANLDKTVELTGEVVEAAPTVWWGYCFNTEAALFFHAATEAYMSCLVENPSSPGSLELLTTSESGLSHIPENATQLAEGIDAAASSGIASLSGGEYAVAFRSQDGEDVGTPSYENVTGEAGVGIGDLISVGAGGRITLFKSTDEQIVGFMYGYNFSVSVGGLPLPVMIGFSTQSDVSFTETPITYSGQNPLDVLQTSMLVTGCFTGQIPTCSLGGAPLIAPLATNWVEGNFASWYAVAHGSGSTTSSSPLPTGPPSQTILPGTIPSSTILSAGNAAVGNATTASSGVAVPLTCNGATGATCNITLALSVTETTSNGKVLAVATDRKKPDKKIVIIGSASLTLTAGEHTIAHITLNSAGRRLRAQHRLTEARLTVSESGKPISSRALSFRPKVARPKHK